MLRFFEFCKTTKKNADDGEKALEMCQKSLEFMAKGGIHDHVSQVNSKIFKFFQFFF